MESGPSGDFVPQDDDREAASGLSLPSLLSIAIVLALVAFLMMALSVVYGRYKVSRNIARVKSDHRILETAIETYYVDNMTYPHSAQDGRPALGEELLPAGYPRYRTFPVRGVTNCIMITTPLAYLSSIPADPFADVWNIPYPFMSSGSGWIVGSWGPDRDQKQGGDLQWHLGDSDLPRPSSEYQNWRSISSGNHPPDSLPPEIQRWKVAPDCPLEELLKSSGNHLYFDPLDRLLLTGDSNKYGQGAYTYDPTNGTISEGDIWRVKL